MAEGKIAVPRLLRIRDEGKGFTADQHREGNGLPSLQRRAQAINAELTINSFANGTTILLRVPHCLTNSQPATQSALAWLRNQQAWPRNAWQWALTYLNRGVTGQLDSHTLPASSVDTKLTKAGSQTGA